MQSYLEGKEHKMKRIAFGTSYLVFVLVLGLLGLTGGLAIAIPGVEQIYYDSVADAWARASVPVGGGTIYSAITMDINEANRAYAAKIGGGIDQYAYYGGWVMEPISGTEGTVYTSLAPTQNLLRFRAARADGGVEHIYHDSYSGNWIRYLIEPSAGIVYNSITMDNALTSAWRFYASKPTGGIDVYQVEYDPGLNDNIWKRTSVVGLTTVYNAIAADRSAAGILYGARQDGGVDRINAGDNTWSLLDVGSQVYTALAIGRGEQYWTLYGAKPGAGGTNRIVNFGDDTNPNFGVYENTSTVGLLYSGLTANPWAYNLLGTFVSAAPTQYSRPTNIGYGSVTVDGNLSDWSDAVWVPLDKNYDVNPTDIEQAAYAVKWSENKVYVAVAVHDLAHKLLDTYTDVLQWNARDGVEIYIHTTNTGSHGFQALQDTAQSYAVGVTDSNPLAVWTAAGAAAALVGTEGFTAAGREDGEWLNYEVAMTPFEFFGGRHDPAQSNVISLLSAGDIIGVDVCAVSNNGTVYTGMKAENLLTGKYNDWSKFGLHRLVSISTIAGAKTTADDGGVTFSGIVTADFGDYFYLEDPARIFGIRVDKAAHGFIIGQAVNVGGIVDTLDSGERSIIATDVSNADAGQIDPLQPLGMTNKALGGGNFGTPPNGQVGVAGATGLNNIGLLVKTTGKVGTKGTDWFMIDDGSGVSVKVIGTVPAGTPYVGVTGISSLETGGVRVIKTRTASDIQEFAP